MGLASLSDMVIYGWVVGGRMGLFGRGIRRHPGGSILSGHRFTSSIRMVGKPRSSAMTSTTPRGATTPESSHSHRYRPAEQFAAANSPPVGVVFVSIVILPGPWLAWAFGGLKNSSGLSPVRRHHPAMKAANAIASSLSENIQHVGSAARRARHAWYSLARAEMGSATANSPPVGVVFVFMVIWSWVFWEEWS